MFLDRLKSGFLLFDTKQGLVRVELSFWQRACLLWTFRNFRRLSLALLTPRQRDLVHTLFRNRPRVVSNSHDRSLEIGIVENFVPETWGKSPLPAKERPPVETGLAPTAKMRQAASLPDIANVVVPHKARMVASPARQPKPIRFSLPKLAWSKVATTFGALMLCVVSVVALHRIQGIPGSQAQNQPRLQPINGTESPNAPLSRKPAAVENPTAIASSFVVSNAAVQLASTATTIPTPKPVMRLRSTASTPSPPISGQDNDIQASRAPLRSVYPVYPDVSVRGVVALTARVGADGIVRMVRVVSGNRALAAAAVRAVRQWRYRPYLKDGRPVATETNIVISFISDDVVSMSFPSSISASQPPTTRVLAGKSK